MPSTEPSGLWRPAGVFGQDVMVRGVLWRFCCWVLREGLLERTVTGSELECDTRPFLPKFSPLEG